MQGVSPSLSCTKSDLENLLSPTAAALPLGTLSFDALFVLNEVAFRGLSAARGHGGSAATRMPRIEARI